MDLTELQKPNQSLHYSVYNTFSLQIVAGKITATDKEQQSWRAIPPLSSECDLCGKSNVLYECRIVIEKHGASQQQQQQPEQEHDTYIDLNLCKQCSQCDTLLNCINANPVSWFQSIVGLFWAAHKKEHVHFSSFQAFPNARAEVSVEKALRDVACKNNAGVENSFKNLAKLLGVSDNQQFVVELN